MKEEDWNKDFHSRTKLYGANVIDSRKAILVEATGKYISTYSGQVTLLTLASLLVRISPNVKFKIDRVKIVEPLPNEGDDLEAYILDRAHLVNPYGQFGVSVPDSPKIKFAVGPVGTGIKVHGDGWYGYTGSSDSPVKSTNECNPFGPAFASIHACAHLFSNQAEKPVSSFLCDTLYWKERESTIELPKLKKAENLGEIWVVGTGSVGTAALFFLTLFNRNFLPILIDHDIVKIHNIGRSPIFQRNHIEVPKVDATKDYIHEAGVENILTDQKAMHESELFKSRVPGKPDIVISAANEFNIRDQLENSYPPIQIYGTTGSNWQANLLRHIPLLEACSCCRFPPSQYIPTECSVGKVGIAENKEDVDASLPFLSYAAGLMTAAEILKLNLDGFPFSRNQTVYYSQSKPHFSSLSIPVRSNCKCTLRDKALTKTINQDSKYFSLSCPENF